MKLIIALQIIQNALEIINYNRGTNVHIIEVIKVAEHNHAFNDEKAYKIVIGEAHKKIGNIININSIRYVSPIELARDISNMYFSREPITF